MGQQSHLYQSTLILKIVLVPRLCWYCNRKLRTFVCFLVNYLFYDYFVVVFEFSKRKYCLARIKFMDCVVRPSYCTLLLYIPFIQLRVKCTNNTNSVICTRDLFPPCFWPLFQEQEERIEQRTTHTSTLQQSTPYQVYKRYEQKRTLISESFGSYIWIDLKSIVVIILYNVRRR